MFRILQKVAGASILIVLAPAPVLAQQPAPSEPILRLPRLTLSVAVGPGDDTKAPVTSFTVQHFLGRHIVIEGDGMRWSGTRTNVSEGYVFGAPPQTGFTGRQTYREERSGWAIGANVLYRTAPRRVAWFAGGGAMVTEERSINNVTTEGCITTLAFPSACRNGTFSFGGGTSKKLAVRALTGIEAGIAGPVSVYGQLEFTTVSQMFGRLSGGVRMTPMTRDAARADDGRVTRLAESIVPRRSVQSARGKKVRVLFASGAQRTGVLMALDEKELVLSESAIPFETRYPLERIRLVEVRRNSAVSGALIGLAGGAGAGVLVALSCGESLECLPAVPVFAAIGSAASALIGGLIDRSKAASNVVWIENRRTVSVAPIISPKIVGAAAAIRW